jgi:hypothetical protein
MHRLSHLDLRSVLKCLPTVYAALDLEAFPRQVLAALRQVIQAPFGSYNEIDPRATRIRYVVEPIEALVSGLELKLLQYMHEQPVVAQYVRTRDPSAKKISDFLNRRAFHRLGIYAENYRRTGVEYQMTFMIERLPKQASPTIAIALDRGRGERDFSERDRLVLNVLRPYLESAYANVETLAAMRRRGSPTGARPETRLFETIVLGSWHSAGHLTAGAPVAGRILRRHAGTRQCVTRHFAAVGSAASGRPRKYRHHVSAACAVGSGA